MDEMRKVARAYYNGAAGTEKELARKLFRSLDANGDGKVSMREYKKLVPSSFSDTDIFKELDENCDGTLDFDEVLALYYMDKVSVPRCRACKSLLVDSYFSCLPCQAEISYYLCCDCYGGGKFKHHHPTNEFIDTRAMLKLLDQILKQSQITTQQTEDRVDPPQKSNKRGKAAGKRSKIPGPKRGGADEEVEKLAVDIVTQGMALEEEKENDNGDEEEEEEEDNGAEEEEEDGVGAEEEEEDNGAKEEEEEDGVGAVEEEERNGAEEEEEEEDDDDDDDDDEDGEAERDGKKDEDEEKVVDEVDQSDNPNFDVNLMDGKNIKRNGEAAGKQSNRRRRTKREKIAKSLEAVNTAVSIGSGVVSVGAIVVATSACCIM